MKRLIAFALLLNAALLGVIAWQLVTDNHNTDRQAYAADKDEILKHMSIVELPIDDKGGKAKTIRFSGVNVQVVNGTGSTWGGTEISLEDFHKHKTNGLGNLIIGYQEMRTKKEKEEAPENLINSGVNYRTGSHNLVVGSKNNYSPYGCKVVGFHNDLAAPFSTICGGAANVAMETHAAIGGGGNNIAARGSVVSGGYGNKALSKATAIGGGKDNTVSASWAAISGGRDNTASAHYSAIGGGRNNTATVQYSPGNGSDSKTSSLQEKSTKEPPKATSPVKPRTPVPQVILGKIYPGLKTGHWIQENDNEKIITLEDGSRWEVSPLERITSLLWLPITKINIGKSNKGFPGYNYLLINMRTKKQVHAKFLGFEK